jgi:hypothetical protein
MPQLSLATGKVYGVFSKQVVVAWVKPVEMCMKKFRNEKAAVGTSEVQFFFDRNSLYIALRNRKNF